MSIKLNLSSTEFHDLHKAADGKGKFAKVSKEQLRTLLADHSRAVAGLGDAGVKIESD